MWIWQRKGREGALSFGWFRRSFHAEHESRKSACLELRGRMREFMDSYVAAIVDEISSNLSLSLMIPLDKERLRRLAARYFADGRIEDPSREASILKAYVRVHDAEEIDWRCLEEAHALVFPQSPGMRMHDAAIRTAKGRMLYEMPPVSMIRSMLDRLFRFLGEPERCGRFSFLAEYGIEHILPGICPFSVGNSFMARMLSWKYGGGFSPWSALEGVDRREYYKLLHQHLTCNGSWKFDTYLCGRRDGAFRRFSDAGAGKSDPEANVAGQKAAGGRGVFLSLPLTDSH